MVFTSEIFSLFAGTATGFIFKYMAQRATERADQFNRMLSAIKASDESADKAAKRVPNDKAGFWIRRLIVMAILFGVILGPFLLALLDKSVVVETTSPIKTWVLGLFQTGGNKVFYQLDNYLLIPEVRQSLMAIIGFYFGNAAAKSSA